MPRLPGVLLAILIAPTTLSAQSPGLPAWFSGCWEAGPPGRIIEERWTSATGGVMLGSGRTFHGQRVTGWEWLRVDVTDGVVTYHALPSGQRQAAFAGTLVNDSVAIFEKPDHDFPQRIAYRRGGPDRLQVRAETIDGARGFDLEFRRVTCEPGPRP